MTCRLWTITEAKTQFLKRVLHFSKEWSRYRYLEKTYPKNSCLNWRASPVGRRAFCAECVPVSIQKLTVDVCTYKSSSVQGVDRRTSRACWVPSLLQLQAVTEPFLKGIRKTPIEQDTQHALWPATDTHYSPFTHNTHTRYSQITLTHICKVNKKYN